MKRARKIMRRSIFTFLKNYQNLTSKPTLLALPFSASILITQALSLTQSTAINDRLDAVFEASGFSESHRILTRKLSQTLISSIYTLPFTLTFFLFSKSLTIQSIENDIDDDDHQKPPKPSPFSLYRPLLTTYVVNALLIVSVNATVFAVALLTIAASDSLGLGSRADVGLFLTAVGGFVYSVVLANAVVVCNLALALSGAERVGGCLAAVKAWLLVKGRGSTGLSLAVAMSVGFASIEALFQLRVVKGFDRNGKKIGSLLVSEGVLICYLYSLVLVVDTLVNAMFYKACVEGFDRETSLRKLRRDLISHSHQEIDCCERV